MQLRHLRYFVALADTLHFGRAAAQLRISQPSLSHQIRQLETILRGTLFERTKRHVQMTETGKVFLDDAREILAHADRAVLNVREPSIAGIERLRVGFAQWMDMTAMIEAIQRLSESHPRIRVDLRSMNVPLQLAALRDNRIDIGFIRPIAAGPSFETEFLVAEPFMIALATNHRLAGRKRIALSSLADESFVSVPGDVMPHFFNLTIRSCRESGFTPRVCTEGDHPSLILGLVRSGIGIALVPASIRRTPWTGVVFRALKPSPPILETAVAWRRDSKSAAIETFLDVVRDVMKNRAARASK